MHQLDWKFSDQEKYCVFIMLNPARTYRLEINPTLNNCKTIAEKENCGGMYILDLFGRVALSGRQLADAKSQGLDIIGGADHDRSVREILQKPNLLIIAAWGECPNFRDYGFKATVEFDERINYMKRMIETHASSKKIYQLKNKNACVMKKCVRKGIKKCVNMSHPYWLADQNIVGLDKKEKIKQEVLKNYHLEEFPL